MIQKNDTDRNREDAGKGLSENANTAVTVNMATGEYYALKSKPERPVSRQARW